MTVFRQALPQLGGGVFLTDGGIETCLIYHDGLELPDFAAFVLLDDAGPETLRRYFRPLPRGSRRARARASCSRAHLAGQPRLGRRGWATRARRWPLPIAAADRRCWCELRAEIATVITPMVVQRLRRAPRRRLPAARR